MPPIDNFLATWADQISETDSADTIISVYESYVEDFQGQMTQWFNDAALIWNTPSDGSVDGELFRLATMEAGLLTWQEAAISGAEQMVYDVIDRLATIATSTLANALDDAGYHHNVMLGMHSVVAGARFAGPAVTVKEISGEFGSFRSEDFRVGAIIDAAKAGDVIVIDGGARRN